MPRRRRAPRPPHALTSLSPRRLALQILLLQTLYYTTILLLLLFTSLITGSGGGGGGGGSGNNNKKPLALLNMLLDWRTIRGDTAAGWTIGAGVWGIGGTLAGSVWLGVVVGRSKMVPDFVLTLHAVHGVLVWGYTGRVPRNALWWALQVGSVGVMGAGGVWSCRWRELRPMSFGGGGREGKEAGRGGYEMVEQQVEDGRVREGGGLKGWRRLGETR